MNSYYEKNCCAPYERLKPRQNAMAPSAEPVKDKSVRLGPSSKEWLQWAFKEVKISEQRRKVFLEKLMVRLDNHKR